MKRFAVIATAMLLACAMLACFSGCGDSKTDVAGVYRHGFPSAIADEEIVEITLASDGQAMMTLPDNTFSIEYYGTYTNDGTTVTLSDMKEIDPLVGDGYPGFDWALTWLTETGDGQIVVDLNGKTYEVVELPESEQRQVQRGGGSGEAGASGEMNADEGTND